MLNYQSTQNQADGLIGDLTDMSGLECSKLSYRHIVFINLLIG